MEGGNIGGFGKLSKVLQSVLAKIPYLIVNNIINIQICQVYITKCVFVVNLPKFATTKVSLYAVVEIMHKFKPEHSIREYLFDLYTVLP